jgi:hypothetical protein
VGSSSNSTRTRDFLCFAGIGSIVISTEVSSPFRQSIIVRPSPPEAAAELAVSGDLSISSVGIASFLSVPSRRSTTTAQQRKVAANDARSNRVPKDRGDGDEALSGNDPAGTAC